MKNSAPKMSPKMSIVIPCYNERNNIPLIVKRMKEVGFDRYNLEVVMLDNGSTDGSLSVLKEIASETPYIKVVRVEKNEGYGHGILTGLSHSSGDFIGWTHADMQTDPNDIVRAYEKYEEQSWPEDLFLKGKRTGRPLFDVFFTAGMSLFETILMGTGLRDINAQPNFFHRAFFVTWKNPPKDFALDLYALYEAKRSKMKIERFPVLFKSRIHGHSHWNTGLLARWKFIKRTISFSLQLRKRIK